MESIIEGKTICVSCKKEITWFCTNHRRTPRNRDIQITSFPVGTQMIHNRDYIDGIPVFEGRCHLCNMLIRLPAEVAATIPEEFHMK